MKAYGRVGINVQALGKCITPPWTTYAVRTIICSFGWSHEYERAEK
jgi:hypothetical protein